MSPSIFHSFGSKFSFLLICKWLTSFLRNFLFQDLICSARNFMHALIRFTFPIHHVMCCKDHLPSMISRQHSEQEKVTNEMFSCSQLNKIPFFIRPTNRSWNNVMFFNISNCWVFNSLLNKIEIEFTKCLLKWEIIN